MTTKKVFTDDGEEIPIEVESTPRPSRKKASVSVKIDDEGPSGASKSPTSVRLFLMMAGSAATLVVIILLLIFFRDSFKWLANWVLDIPSIPTPGM